MKEQEHTSMAGAAKGGNTIPAAWHEFVSAIANLPAGAEPNWTGMQGKARALIAQARAAQAATEFPAILFDGMAVLEEVRAHGPNPPRTSANNVSEVLDAVVRLMRKDRAAQAAVPVVTADERALFMQAIDSTYPIPNNPHQSVVQRAMDNREAFSKGWEQARAALATPLAPAQPAGAADTTASASDDWRKAERDAYIDAMWPAPKRSESIDTPEFQALAGTWCGASQSCDQWTRTVGAKQAWSDMIAYIDSRATLAPVAAQQAAAKAPMTYDEFFAEAKRLGCKLPADFTGLAAKAPAAQAVDAPDAEHVARIVTDEDKAALLNIINELGWSVNGTFVVTKSGDMMHTLDALSFARTVRSFLAATPASTPEASQQGDKLPVVLELPDGDERTARVVWSEVKDGKRHLCIVVSDASQQAAAVAAPSDDDIRDAGRYRWLRNGGMRSYARSPHMDGTMEWSLRAELPRAKSIDEAIDAAMRATQQEGDHA